MLGQALNLPVVALASSAYVATNWPESDVKRLADQFNAKFLVDWDDSGESSVLLDQLRDGKSFTWLEEIARANGLHVYRILRNE